MLILKNHKANALIGSLLAISLLTACPPKPVGNAPTNPQASAGSTATPDPGASRNPEPGTTPTPPSPGTGETPSPEITPTPGASASVGAGGSGGFTLPDNLSSIRLATVNRFLNFKGETTRLNVELIDNIGNVIPVDVPLEWISSRPLEISVDAEGNVKALVEFGFTTITAKIPGTSFETRTVININSVNSGGGGGGAGGGGGGTPAVVNVSPVITSLIASSTSVTGAGVLLKLTAAATDSDSTLTNASYSWSCDQANCGSQFTATQGTEVYWRSPATGGAYTLKLTVSDGQASTSREIGINVIAGQGQLQVNPPI